MGLIDLAEEDAKQILSKETFYPWEMLLVFGELIWYQPSLINQEEQKQIDAFKAAFVRRQFADANNLFLSFHNGKVVKQIVYFLLCTANTHASSIPPSVSKASARSFGTKR